MTNPLGHILIVDDESAVRHLCSDILCHAGYSCSEAENAAQARVILTSVQIDMIVSDINMPGESGLDFARFIRSAYPDTGIITMTGYGTGGIISDAIDIGVYGHVNKPFERDQLMVSVDNAFKRLQLEKRQRQILEELDEKVHERTAMLQQTIDELQCVQEKFKTSERKYRVIFENSPLGMLHFDSKGNILECNEQFAELMGAPREKLVGFNSAENAPLDMRTAVRKALGGTSVVYEDLYTSVLGNKTQDIRAVMNPVTPGKSPSEVIVTLENISERKRAENELRTSLKKNEQLIQMIPSFLIGISEDGKILQWNQVAEKIFWMPAEDLLGTDFSQCMIRWDHDKVKPAIRECQEKYRRITLENVCFRRAEGDEGVLEVSLIPIAVDGSSRGGLLIMGTDTTERLALETELAQARKLEAVGQLAAGIAHEINTPIQYVSDNTTFFKEAFEDITNVLKVYKQVLAAGREGKIGEDMLDMLDSAMKEADLEFLEEELPVAFSQTLEGLGRVAAIVHSMKEFSHPGGTEKKCVNINNALESTITVSRNEWKYVAEMEKNLDPDLPVVSCLAGEMNQVFLNLITNAAHAITEAVGDSGAKGTITISTAHVSGWAEIRIKDTGTGIPEKARDRVFDPFFTTKEVGRGTGQGLNISRTVVVEKHKGQITFETECGKGTTFIIRLPLS